MNVRHVVYLAAGAVVGGITGYLVADLVAYKLQEKWIKKDILNEFEENVKDYKSGEDPVVVIGVDYAGKDKGNLTTLAKPYQEEFRKLGNLIEEAREEWTTEALTTDSIYSGLPLYEIITHQQWDNFEYADHETLMYYEDDETFATVDEELITNPTDHIGPSDLLRFGKESEDPDVVYIRNNDTETDYEVIRVHGKFSTLIMGMSEEEVEEKPPAKKTRRKKSAADDES